MGQHIPQEDTEYLNPFVEDFAIEDEAALEAGMDEGELSAETRVIKEIRTYLKEALAEHDSLRVIDLTEEVLTVKEQMAVHKLAAQHVHNIRAIINKTIEEN